MSAPDTEKRPKTRLERDRARYLMFNILNPIGFLFLSGNIPSLFALQLGATGTYIGILGSLNFLTFLFMPIGRRAIQGRRIITVFGWSWMLRYSGMVLALAAPFLAAAGKPGWGLALLFAGTLAFNVFRGVGMIGNNPLLGMMAGERDRGAFLSSVMMTNSLTVLVTSVATTFILGRWSGNLVYGLLMGAGVIVGYASVVFLLGLPEPEAYRPAAGSSLLATVKEAWTDPRFRRFIAVFGSLSFSAGTARTFIVTHARVLYAQNAGLVMLYFVAMNVGSLAAGYLSRKAMDRLGSKPLYVLFIAVTALAMVPAAISPNLGSALTTAIFLIVLNFLGGFGIAGEEIAGQSYFFSIVKPAWVVDLGVIYYIVYGLGGALGSALGGVFLDSVEAAGASSAVSYRLLYLFSFLVTIFAVTGAFKLKAPGATSVRESLGILLSMRDLKVIGLLERLEKSGTPAGETKLIRQLGGYGAAVAERELLPYLSSPRLEVRIEALRALENLDRLSSSAIDAIIAEMERNPYTTAYVAARIMGKRHCTAAIPALRRGLATDDYMFRGASITALAELGDLESLPAIESLVSSTDNPRLMIAAASAIESFGSVSSVPALVSALKNEAPPPYVFDEIVLAMAGILGGLRGFYMLYSRYSTNPEEGISALMDTLETAALEEFRHKVTAFILDGSGGEAVARAIIDSGFTDTGTATILAEASLDDELAAHGGFRFFLAACAFESIHAAAEKE
jgi:MFS family permease